LISSARLSRSPPLWEYTTQTTRTSIPLPPSRRYLFSVFSFSPTQPTRASPPHSWNNVVLVFFAVVVKCA
jgi:hypothetical protein